MYTGVRKVLVTSDVSRNLGSFKLGGCRSYLWREKSEYALSNFPKPIEIYILGDCYCRKKKKGTKGKQIKMK